MQPEFINTIPVLPSADIDRDVEWYQEKMGLTLLFANSRYAVLHRSNFWIHLQWHADTEHDPLLGGSVIRIFMRDIKPIFQEFIERGTITKDHLKTDTPWETNEFGFYDLNKNAIFVVEDAEK